MVRLLSILPILLLRTCTHSVTLKATNTCCPKRLLIWRNDDTAVAKDDMCINYGSSRQLHKTTKGWQLCIKWKDGTTSWERLADLKESNPIEVAEFVVAQGLHDEPAFLWWVPYTLKHHACILAAVNKRHHKQTHKFGIEIPKTYDDCVRLDQQNGNTLWQDAICKETSKVKVTFWILNDGESVPPTFQEMRCHMVYNVKMENF